MLIHDPLTGAYSRAFFESRVREEIDRTRRSGGACVLCLLDIDHFKSINDAYGHPRGDQVLHDFIQCIQGSLRTSDMLFRYGGDEFVLLLPQTHKAQALVLCRRLLDKVAVTVFDGDPPLSVSFSMGLAVFPSDAKDGAQLLEVADRRNYRAKREGRNRLASEDAPTERRLHFDPNGRLIERDAALETLQKFFQAPPGSPPTRPQPQPCSVLAILGQPGDGRSRFLSQAMQIAKMQHTVVLSLQATRALQHRPYGALMTARWPLPLPLAGGAAAVDDALRQGLATQGKQRLLIAVDDWPLLDRATRELVQRLLSVSSIPALALAYTGLPDTPPVASAAAQSTAEIWLQPLSRKGLEVWLRELLQQEPEAAFCDWLAQRTGGHPGQVRELLTSLAAHRLLQAAEAGGWELSPDYATNVVAPEREHVVPPNNLPASVTDFIGRDKLCWELDQLLATRRLVTLVGPGGIGKTRLALELAVARQELYADGVWFIALESAQTPDLVVSAIAQALAVKQTGQQSLLQILKNYLRDKTLLLFLDNFEQVLDAASVVEEILLAAPQVQIVVTSRERLRVSGEQVFSVPPLHLPDLTDLTDPASLQQSEAVALFVDRAKQVSYDFVLTNVNAQVVAEICVRLEGLPLAIELAAARTNQFSPQQLAAQLQHRLTALVDGPRTVTARQRTVRDTIQWSYSLLTPAEQGAFARLGVFWGGCTSQSAEQICCEEPGLLETGERGLSRLSAAALRSSLTALVNKSLLYLREGLSGEARFTMLETVREYAAEQLELTGEAEQLRERHALHFLALAEEAEPHLTGPDQREWLDRLESEHNNLYAALDWLCNQGRVELALRFAVAAWKFWQIRAQYHDDGRQWLKRVLELGGPDAKHIASSFRARALWGAGRLAEDLSDLAGSEAIFSESLAVARACGDERAVARALHALAEIVTRRTGDMKRAEAMYLESLEGFRRLNDIEDIGWTLLRLGDLYCNQGDYLQAMSLYEQSLAALREFGQKRAMAVVMIQLASLLLLEGRYEAVTELLNEALTNMEGLGDIINSNRVRRYQGQMALQTGDYAQARSILEECVRISRSISDEFCLEISLTLLGATLLAQNDPQQAKPMLEEALPIARRLFNHRNVAGTLVLLGHAAVAMGDAALAAQAYRESLEIYRSRLLLDSVPEGLEGLASLALLADEPADVRRAARFLGAADALRQSSRLARTAFMQATYASLREMVGLKLGEAACAEARREGEALTIDQAVSEALAATG